MISCEAEEKLSPEERHHIEGSSRSTQLQKLARDTIQVFVGHLRLSLRVSIPMRFVSRQTNTKLERHQIDLLDRSEKFLNALFSHTQCGHIQSY
jgi:hypothetical protein